MDRRRIVRIGALGVAALAVGATLYLARLDGIGPRLGQESDEAAYPSAETCATCHPVAAEEWRASAHAWAGENVLVHASVCGPCHAPVGTQLEPEYLFKLTSGGDLTDLPAAAGEGVTCIACHAETHGPEAHVLTFEPVWPNWRTTDLALRIEPWAAARGPFGHDTSADPAAVANASHENRLDAALTQSELCRPCHDVTLDKGPLAEQADGPQPVVRLLTTYEEWSASSYAQAGRTCQSCHMPRLGAPAPAAVAPPGVEYDAPLPLRPHADHSLMGVDTAYWDEEAPTESQARRAADLLAQAAALEIAAPAVVSRGESASVEVTIRNVGAGHDLMTGFSFWREAWLEVTVTDANGREVFSSGHVDADGWLADEYSPHVRRNPDLYDPYLVQLRTRLVRSPDNLAAWLQPDRTVAVPEGAITRNLNGTPVLGWSEFDVAPIVARLEGAAGRTAAASSPLEDVYVLRYAEALIRNGVPAGGSKTARYPVAAGDETVGPLKVSARLLLRALGRQMTQQQEEIRDDPPLQPIYVVATAHATVQVAAP